MSKQQIVEWDNKTAFAKELKASGHKGKSLAPFSLVGGKSRLTSYLLELIPPHNNYIEVFGGGLNLLWAKKRSKFEVVNDFDSELVNLYSAIKFYPDSLQRELSTMWHSRELFAKYKKGMCRNPHNQIEKAAITYYMIATSFAQKRGHFGRNLFGNGLCEERLYRNFSVWSQRLRGVQIENGDFQKIIEDYDGDNTFFYLDPPYYGSETYYQSGGFNRESHERLAKTLKTTKSKWLLSYNDTEQIRELYKDYEILQTPEFIYTMPKNTVKKIREIVIKNY